MKRNTEFRLTVSAPLIRTGLQIEAGPVSETYVVETAKKLLDFVHEINRPTVRELQEILDDGEN